MMIRSYGFFKINKTNKHTTFYDEGDNYSFSAIFNAKIYCY